MREIKLVESKPVEIGLALETRSSQSQESTPSLVAGFAVSLATRLSSAQSQSGLEKLEKEGELLPTSRPNQIISSQQISHVARVRGVNLVAVQGVAR